MRKSQVPVVSDNPPTELHAGLPSDWLTRLEQALIQEFHCPDQKVTFERQKSIADALNVTACGKAAYLVRPFLRMAGYFDFSPDLLILDDHLGTLGLAWGLEGGEPEAIEEQVRQRIDAATYIRHLLELDAAGRPAEAQLTRSVELVLVTSADNSLMGAVGAVLRDIASRTSYLHAVGVNLLRWPAAGEVPTSHEIGRAFAWMLRRTRAWYTRRAAVPKGSRSRKPRPLARMTLTNYRLEGKRTLPFDLSSHVHLIHGHNGSGKSSLVEALELATTGSIERLQAVDEKRYDLVIPYRRRGEAEPSAPAEIRLELRGDGTEPGETWEAHVTTDGINTILDPKQRPYRATSFRLDQTVMDRLGRSGDRQRADTFLSAFFPDDAKIHSAYQTARKEAREAREDLPEAVHKQIEELTTARSKEPIEKVVLDFFHWLEHDKKQSEAPETPEQPLPEAAIRTLLPLTFEVLEDLIPLAPEIQAFVSRWQSSPLLLAEAETDLRKLDEALKKIQSGLEPTLQALQTAVQALQELSGWYVADDDSTGEGVRRVLDAWLEKFALADLAERQLQVSRSLSAASRAGWKAYGQGGGLFEYLASQGQLARLESQAADWTSERDQLFNRLSSISRSLRGATSFSAPVSRPRPYPSNSQIAALDTVGAWLAQSTPPPPGMVLGGLIQQMLQSPNPKRFGTYSLGHDPEWAQPILDRLSRLQKACEKLQQLGKGSRMMTGSRRLEIFQKVFRRHDLADKAGSKVSETLLSRLEEVNDALNELMALFTPARWAYGDVHLTHSTGEDGLHAVGFQTGEERTRAELRFNTAELNVFTVALFLLCSVRVPNPLRLLVFDDPLQNMDELTVTTLARGMARVVRLLPESWQMLLLFHGEDDLDRFRREVPSTLYSLPWLTPAERSLVKAPEIVVETGRRAVFQPLKGLMGPTPASGSDTIPAATSEGKSA